MPCLTVQKESHPFGSQQAKKLNAADLAATGRFLMSLDLRVGDLRAGAGERMLIERSRPSRTDQAKEGQRRFATYFVMGLAVIGVGAAVASFMPLP